jgi:N-methylhydantoinase A
VTIILAVDIGGTFTDLAAYDPESQQVAYAKRPTTYGNFAAGIADCIEDARLTLDQVALFKHGTTLVVNALLERTGARTALVTTRGFRDVLHIGRGNRLEPFDLFYQRAEPLVAHDQCYEIGGRIDGTGQEIIPLDRDGLQSLADRFRAAGIEAVAVSLLNGYRNPAHERAAQEYLAAALPDVFITIGTDLSMEWREFERAATAVANAYVGPKVKHYLHALQDDLDTRQFTGRFFVTASNGGVLSVPTVLSKPLYLVESGPAGGCIGAAALAEPLGIRNLIAFDMGGTTAKCALVEDGKFGIETQYRVGSDRRSFPIQVPVIDVVEVGAGGGSIAWLDDGLRLHVGPRSAGSHPGPVAYGWGGTEPTVTDANLTLGRLDPTQLLGGDLAVDAPAAREAIRDKLARPLGYEGAAGVRHIASGIVSIANVIMAGAIKRITIERGRDPRDYSLLAYGGAGPLHAADLARELRIPWVVVPPEPGNFAATGMLLADVRRDDTRTHAGPVTDDSMPDLLRALRALEHAGHAALTSELGAIDIDVEYFAEIRYTGQEHSVRTRISGLTTADQIRDVFEQTYRRRYGHADPRSPIETVNLHVTSVGRISKPHLEQIQLTRTSGEPVARSRQVVFADNAGALPTAVYDRTGLPPGFNDHGPAIIEEYGATTVVGPQDTFQVGPRGELRIRVGAPGSAGTGSDAYRQLVDNA